MTSFDDMQSLWNFITYEQLEDHEYFNTCQNTWWKKTSCCVKYSSGEFVITFVDKLYVICLSTNLNKYLWNMRLTIGIIHSSRILNSNKYFLLGLSANSKNVIKVTRKGFYDGTHLPERQTCAHGPQLADVCNV